ncbi:unnamed protein product [Linum tenue]|uniref:Uncharacterized protein n=1 Tax=Linum tenue TaxID=586396 RepID=A0AAV0ICE0_9ROSI|nr:unnamed protein product [Linum tenue]
MRSSFSISASRTCTLSLNFPTRTARLCSSSFAATLSPFSSSYRLAFTISPNQTSMKSTFIPTWRQSKRTRKSDGDEKKGLEALGCRTAIGGGKARTTSLAFFPDLLDFKSKSVMVHIPEVTDKGDGVLITEGADEGDDGDAVVEPYRRRDDDSPPPLSIALAPDLAISFLYLNAYCLESAGLSKRRKKKRRKERRKGKWIHTPLMGSFGEQQWRK